MRRGTRVGQAYVAVSADGTGINEEIVDSVEEAIPDVEKAGDRAGNRFGRRFSARFRERLTDVRAKVSEKLADQLHEIGERAGARSGDAAGETFSERMTTKVKQVGTKVSKELGDRMASRPEQIRRGVDRAFDDDFADRMARRFAESFVDSLEVRMSVEGSRLNKMFSRVVSGGLGGRGRDRDQDLAGRVGRMFGTGSRNNFLNILGRSITGIMRGTTRYFKVLRSAPQLFSKFKAGVDSVVPSGNRLFDVFRKLGAGLGSKGIGLSGALASAGPAAAAVLVVTSALVSVMGALLGIVTALISTIASGLVGALAVAGGAIMSVVAAGGLLTAAFMSMTDAQKKMLSTAFKPLRAQMVGIGQLMLRDMVPAFQTWSTNLQQALQLLAPVANVMGKAFAEAGNTLTASFSGPGFQAFSNALGVYLPNIVNRLSAALGGFLNGLTGMFSAIMPYVNQFAGYLQQVATRFSEWANSAQGQNAIEDFVGRAVESLKSLWGFIREFSGFVSDILFSPAAQNAGNTIFDGLKRAFEGFRASISSGDLERWFGDAIKFGSQLWELMQALGGTIAALYNSGVLEGVGTGIEAMANVINALNLVLTPVIDLLGVAFPAAVALAMAPVQAAAGIVMGFVNTLREVGNWLSHVPGLGGLNSGDVDWSNVTNTFSNMKGQFQDAFTNPSYSTPSSSSSGPMMGPFLHQVRTPSTKSLIDSGNRALAATNASTNLGPAKYVNPYKNWANSLIKEGPSISKQITDAINKVNKEVFKTLREASEAENKKAARTTINGLKKSIRDQGKAVVEAARNQLNSAARSLASASSRSAAASALAEVRKAQADLRKAQKAQDRIQKAARMLDRQNRVRPRRVNRLVNGVRVQNATLAEYAAARNRVSNKLEKANKKLTDAIEMRRSYRESVRDSVREFGSLLSAQAQVIDGVTQSLTAGDITGNLEQRLDQIRTFRENLRILVSQGLSEDAYKQLVDAGVEQGGEFAQALVDGGYGGVGYLNDLVGQVDQAAKGLGKESSTRLYKAGVDAARGLVEGLESLSDRIDNAAGKLGRRIAKAIQKALGIKSPSRVMRALMVDVGDGMVLGMDDQHTKVGSAAADLAQQVAVSPEVARYAAQQAVLAAAASSPSGSEETVSGNMETGQKFRDLIVHTPTENPKAVAMEVLNEVTGRL